LGETFGEYPSFYYFSRTLVENYVNEKVASGKFSSVSEVIRTALRLLENEENRYKALTKELEIGEKSGFIKDFDRKENLKNLHAKHLKK